MKLLFENWRRYIGEAKDEETKSSCDEILWHGSQTKFDGPVKPSQAEDIGGNPEQNLKAVYATDDKKLAIMIGLVGRDEDGNWPDVFNNVSEKPLQLVVVSGKIRRGEKVYLYKLPKDAFRNTGVPKDKPEWVSETPVEPCGTEEVNVDDYLHLVRKATPEDLEFYEKHGGKVNK